MAKLASDVFLKDVRVSLMGKVHPDGHFLARLPNGLDISIVSSLDMPFLYEEIFEQRTYLQHGVTLHEGAVVLDIGANIGLFSIFAAGIAGRQVRGWVLI